MAERSQKLILDSAALNEMFFDEACLLGIMAPIRDYQFIWHLNAHLQLDFRINDLEIGLIRKKREYFSRSMNIAVANPCWNIICMSTNSTANTCSPS